MIRQFDLFETPPSRGSNAAPLIRVLQSHYLAALNTVVVAPLLLAKGTSTPSQAAVPVTVNGLGYVLDLTLMANIDRAALRRRVGSLIDQEFDIRRALDRLFTGF